MSLSTRLQSLVTRVNERYGEQVTVTRKNADGTTTTFTAYCRPQPLTPTFVHTLNNEAMENLNENDQRDFVFSGSVDIRDLDVITWNGYEWDVSTASEQRVGGVNVTMHALSVKRKVQNATL